MHERCASSSDSDENEQKNYPEEFIRSYEASPALWNPKHTYYLNTAKRNEELDKLLKIYKKIKPWATSATREDVRKKINSLRSNYRKELKKIENSKRSGNGAEKVYTPTSSTFYSLQFLSQIENPEPKKDNDSSEVRSEEDYYIVISSVKKENPPVKVEIRKNSKTPVTQDELLNKACSILYQPQDNDSSEVRSEEGDSFVISSNKNEKPPMKIRKNSRSQLSELRTAKRDKLHNKTCSISSQPPVSTQDVNPLALIWTDKLKSLSAIQKLYAEKAINDILFEAQLNTLHRNSVQINVSETSSPVAHAPIDLIPDNYETCTSPDTGTTHTPVSHVNLIPENCESQISPETATTYTPAIHIPFIQLTETIITQQKP